jgi:hypothetical protein
VACYNGKSRRRGPQGTGTPRRRVSARTETGRDLLWLISVGASPPKANRLARRGGLVGNHRRISLATLPRRNPCIHNPSS